jgi:hypothetical protein
MLYRAIPLARVWFLFLDSTSVLFVTYANAASHKPCESCGILHTGDTWSFVVLERASVELDQYDRMYRRYWL